MKILTSKQLELRERIIKILEKQGFKTNSILELNENSKEEYKKLQEVAMLEQYKASKKFILSNMNKVKEFTVDGSQLKPEDIDLELREVKAGSLDEIIYRWWNLVWWSIPYQKPIGRQMRFLVWDKAHNAPFGLLCLQSPILKMADRDRYLKLKKEDLDIWVNKSMNAQRVGALPPYNQLIGGKMVALALISNEIRNTFEIKYKDKRINELLFITTTSAFGKSSIYNRLKYKDGLVAKPIGYTKGYGTFHIPNDLYKDILSFLNSIGVNTETGIKAGSSRKLRLIHKAFKYLDIPSYTHHGINREIYLFSLVDNLEGVIHNEEVPRYYDRPLKDIVDYWKERWAIPRALRKNEWLDYKTLDFFREKYILIEGV